MKVTWSLMSPFPTPCTCPLRIMFITRVSLQRSLCRFNGKEAHPRLDQAFEKTMVLFDQIVEGFHLPQFHAFRKPPGGFELGNGFGRGRILIDSDHPRSRLRGVGVSRSRRLGHRLLDWTSLRH